MDMADLSFMKNPMCIISTVFLVSIVILVFFSPFFPLPKPGVGHIAVGTEPVGISEDIEGFFSGPATEEELFELIVCPCCGSPISAGCCGSAIQRQDYVKGMIDAGASKKEVLLAAAKEYGMESILDESLQEELMAELVKDAPEDRPIIAIEPDSLDFGDVSFAGGEASASFLVRNDGKSDLVISNMESSCGCTTAALLLDGIEGPRFGMPGHGLEQPEGWSATIRPGSTAELKVYYDPTVHPTLRGPVTRTVTVISNDPVNFGAKVRIEVNQVD